MIHVYFAWTSSDIHDLVSAAQIMRNIGLNLSFKLEHFMTNVMILATDALIKEYEEYINQLKCHVYCVCMDML